MSTDRGSRYCAVMVDLVAGPSLLRRPMSAGLIIVVLQTFPSASEVFYCVYPVLGTVLFNTG
jgi:hypothetical protein